MTERNEKCPGSAERTSPAAERMEMFELDGPSIAAVAGGLNPQPLPPRVEPRLD